MSRESDRFHLRQNAIDEMAAQIDLGLTHFGISPCARILAFPLIALRSLTLNARNACLNVNSRYKIQWVQKKTGKAQRIFEWGLSSLWLLWHMELIENRVNLNCFEINGWNLPAANDRRSLGACLLPSSANERRPIQSWLSHSSLRVLTVRLPPVCC